MKDNILHRDLKPSNILLHNDVIKLADFGFCKSLSSENDLTKTMVGSPIYMAPEILFGKDYGTKAEIWSLGCVLFELLFGECPFEERTIPKLMNRIEESEVKMYRGFYIILFIIIYYYLLLFIIIYYYLLLFIIIYYYLLLFVFNNLILILFI